MSQVSLFDPPKRRKRLLLELEEAPGEWAEGRWYQREAKDAAREKLKEAESAITVMATGLGKTQTFARVAQEWDKSINGNDAVLILAHRKELVHQARDRLEAMTGEYVEIEQAELRCSPKTRLVVGSVDTVKQKRRLERLGQDRFGLVVFDECHHGVARTYRRPLEYFNAKILGYTATPDRADEKALGQIFEEEAYVMDIEDGIADGHLVPLTGNRVFIDEIDLDNVDTSAGDLAAGQLDEEILKGVEGIVQKTLEIQPNRQALAFFPGVHSAAYAAEAFNRRIPGSAAFVHGGTDPDERTRLVREFKEGRFLYFCNCNILTEGFDAPAADLVIQARPTKSRSLYAQMVGRVTRPLPGMLDHLREKHQAQERQRLIETSAKPRATILDFVGNSSKHTLMTVTDVLGGNYDEEEVAKAKKKIEKSPGTDPRKALVEAKAELEALRKARLRVVARVESFDPFKLMGVTEGDSAVKMRFGDAPATDGQLDYLRAKKIPEEYLRGLTKRDASKLISTAKRRRSEGLATYAQIHRLARYGVNATPLSFTRASKVLDYIASCGWSASKMDQHHLENLINAPREPGEEG